MHQQRRPAVALSPDPLLLQVDVWQPVGFAPPGSACRRAVTLLVANGSTALRTVLALSWRHIIQESLTPVLVVRQGWYPACCSGVAFRMPSLHVMSYAGGGA